MILSASRRTDIPNYYSEWFLKRIAEGYVYVRNPYNKNQISKIDLSPEVVDCIVFWTKNPQKMIPKLDQLKKYLYYFQFTLTGYGTEIEPGVPHKRNKMISIFQELSNVTGNERVIWRYDPVFFTSKYTEKYHLKAFEEIAVSLNGYTQRVEIGFLKMYEKTKRNMKDIILIEKSKEELYDFAEKLALIATKNGLIIESCAGEMDLTDCGIEKSSCINKNLIEEMAGFSIDAGKDKNQRQECGCMESIEIGAYNTCLNGCKYCYGNENDESVESMTRRYETESPILCEIVKGNEKITERKMRSLKNGQMNLIF